MSTVALQPRLQARFINPNSDPAKQIEVFKDLLNNPPENSRTITITPSLAEWILAELHSGQNRSKRPRKIAEYQEAMRNDRWLLTGATIVFGKSGKLLDGQNRLIACLRSGVAFRSYVIFGIAESVFAALDIGARRNTGDAFQVAGIPYHQITAAAVRWLILYDAGTPTARSEGFSNPVMFEFWRTKVDHLKISAAIDYALRANKALPRGTLAAHLYLFDRSHPATAKRFSQDLAKGIRVGRKLPGVLDRYRKQNMGRLHEVWINALIIQAWNAYRSGQSLTARHLKWTDAKEYPEIA